MAPRILIFSIAMGADCSFYVKSIATYAPAFLGYDNSALARVLCIHIPSIYLGLGFEFEWHRIRDIAFVCPKTLNSNIRRYLSSKLADLCKNIINLSSLNTLPRCKKQKVWLWHFRLAHRSKTRFGKRDEMRICFDDKLTIFSNPVKVVHSGMKFLLNMNLQFSPDNLPDILQNLSIK